MIVIVSRRICSWPVQSACIVWLKGIECPSQTLEVEVAMGQLTDRLYYLTTGNKDMYDQLMLSIHRINGSVVIC